jgi:hypothetical protein
MNMIWMRFLCRLNDWTVRQYQRAHLRERVRRYRRELERIYSRRS